ncbi:putative DNA-binding transcriptional regulator YafY [Geomicrobium sediminis]|uniref:DNA-binding transcriptional regulator YafY n=1 Tax=Geomicrobium sediminis TaxID=1347788 RepID=A0ABS2P9H5_9BACL|nr:putative DNA-binding transcriptional regulator YafY [Geomicrobium sediminis]
MSKYVLQHSRSTSMPIQIIYEAKDGSLSQRLVTVRRMNEENVFVWCHNKKAVRSLRVENILSAQKRRQRMMHAYA